MPIEIGSFDAKAKLSQLLREVQRGQSYTITVRGRPVANLVPSENADRKNAYTAVEAMRALHKVQGVSSDTLAEWVSKGRK